MSKIDILIRHSVIIQRLKRSPATLKEINEYLALESDLTGNNLQVSNRTFTRDKADILSIWKINIECEKSSNKYYIETMDENSSSLRLLDTFITAYAVNSTTGYSQFLQLEDYAKSGSENFHGILHAIKNNLQIHIFYQSYWSDTEVDRIVNPYLLKEFKNRWYLIGMDVEKQAIRTFALDRLKNLEITRKKFSYPVGEKPQNYYNHSFGIISKEEGQELETIVLSFTEFQGKYIKSLPLHHSQKILKDDMQGLIISLKVYPTYDFIKEILSHGETVKVLEPKSLIDTIKRTLAHSLSQY
ncbi:MAG: WYL domain-containing protein [Bacteroidota bacterium]